MIQIDLIEMGGFKAALWGMRNPKDSWSKSDSVFDVPDRDVNVLIGECDLDLAKRLADGGSVHGKFRRMMKVWVNIKAPLYWWKEFDTYRFGVEKDSCSTMHTLHKRDLTGDDFSYEHLYGTAENGLVETINIINHYRRLYVEAVEKHDPIAKDYWWNMIQLLPSSFNQLRTVELNYEVLANICEYRANHKLDEWRDFVIWAEKLPYSELFLQRMGMNGHG